MGNEPVTASSPTSLDASYFLQLQTQTGWGRTLLAFAEWCQPRPGWRTLDVGCGPGLLPALFARQSCRAFGVDLDPGMFAPRPLHPWVCLGDALRLPFAGGSFELVTASNVLFLLEDPAAALREMRRVLAAQGQVRLLNPSEQLSVGMAQKLADERGLDGLARQSLVSWAGRAESHPRWDEAYTQGLFAAAGLTLVECSLKIGPGLARFSCGVRAEG